MKTQTKRIPLAALLTASLFLTPLFVSAQALAVVQEAHTSAVASSTTDSSTTATASKDDAKVQAAKDKADKEIDRRTNALGDLLTRIDAMERVTANFKQTLTTNINSQITGLKSLKDKIDADSDIVALKTDIKSVTDTYRTFTLILPQARIVAAADREVTLIAMMSQLGSKLQARASASQSAGSDVSKLLADLTDMSAKLTDASTQAQAAVSVSASLATENGDQTIMAQNTTAIKTARADINTSKKDLDVVSVDAEQIIKGLKSLPTPVATTTASSSTP